MEENWSIIQTAWEMLLGAISFLDSDFWTIVGGIVALTAAIAKIKSWYDNHRRIARVLGAPNHRLLHKVVGRDSLTRQIANGFAEDVEGNRDRIVVLAGGAGCGKTTLARHYLNARREDYARVLFLPAETQVGLVDALSDLTTKIKGSEAPPSAKARAAVALDIIAQETATDRWLVVYDNAVSQSDLLPWLADGRRLDIIVTSRDPDWTAAGVRVIQPGVLDPQAAETLLEQQSGRDDPGYAGLAEKLGHLPLALVQAGEWLRAHPERDADSYVKRMERLIDEHAPEATDYAASTGGALRLTYQSLSRDAQAIARCLCVFDPDHVEPFAFEQLRKASWSRRTRARFLGLPSRVWRVAKSQRRLDAAFRELSQSALIERSDAESAFRMHRVTSMVIKKKVGASRAFRATSALLFAGFPTQTIDSGTWPIGHRLMPHIRMIRAAFDKEELPVQAIVSHLVIPQSDFLWRTGFTSEAREVVGTFKDTFGDNFLVSKKIKAKNEFELAKALSDDGEHAEAEEILRRIIAEDEAGGGTSNLPAYYTILAKTLEKQSGGSGEKSHECLKAYQKALALGIRFRGRNSATQAQDLNNLGATRFARGQNAAAKRLLRKSGATFATALEDPYDYRHSYSQGLIGQILLEEGNPHEALPLFAECLRIRRQAFEDTPRHYEVMVAASDLVVCLLTLADSGPAEVGYEVWAHSIWTEYEEMPGNIFDRIAKAQTAMWDGPWGESQNFGYYVSDAAVYPWRMISSVFDISGTMEFPEGADSVTAPDLTSETGLQPSDQHTV